MAPVPAVLSSSTPSVPTVGHGVFPLAITTMNQFCRYHDCTPHSPSSGSVPAFRARGIVWNCDPPSGRSAHPQSRSDVMWSIVERVYPVLLRTMEYGIILYYGMRHGIRIAGVEWWLDTPCWLDSNDLYTRYWEQHYPQYCPSILLYTFCSISCLYSLMRPSRTCQAVTKWPRYSSPCFRSCICPNVIVYLFTVLC
jgi:hypothetical protein